MSEIKVGAVLKSSDGSLYVVEMYQPKPTMRITQVWAGQSACLTNHNNTHAGAVVDLIRDRKLELLVPEDADA